MRFLLHYLLLIAFCGIGFANDAYRYESIPLPPSKTKTEQIDGLCFTPKGDLVVALPSGEIWKKNRVSHEWTLFAEGLHNPLGILALGESDFIVAHRPEVTRIRDTDEDGLADDYSCVSDDFGMSGNYHEFNFTPVKDKNGNIYFGLGTASRNNGVRQIVRGKFDKRGRPGRMHASVPYRGWIMKITKDGKTIPFSSGHRTPNGLGFDLKGRLYVTDNQGDWVGTSKLYHVQEGHFYGHPASLNWKKGFKETALRVGAEKLDRLRSRACIQLPHGFLSNSPTQPIVDDTKGKFGPYHGQMFIGEMNKSYLLRVMLEEVDGQMQGACIPFQSPKGFPIGGNRLAFAPDGSLYVGHTKHTWAGSKGLSRLVYTGHKPFDLLKMNLTKKGFRLEFTEPLDEASAKNLKTWNFKRYFYSYHERYGSQQYDVEETHVKSLKVMEGGKVVELQLDQLKPWTIHELNLAALKSSSGKTLKSAKVYYTLNRLIENTPAAPRQWDAGRVAKKKK